MIYVLTTAGCSYEVFNRKFIRKKKKDTGPPPIYHIEPFVKPPNAQIYSHAFLFWKTWEGELLIALSPAGYPRVVNNLRVKERLDQSVATLAQMKSCLNKAKARALTNYIKDIEQFSAFLENQGLSDSGLARMRRDIEGHKMSVEIRFSPKAVKNDMAPE